MSIKCLLVGISDYSKLNAPNLNFCKNDVLYMNDALIKGLNVDERNIFIYGMNNAVIQNEFLEGLNILCSSIDKDDTVIFYFTGHGTTYEDKHYLVFSDGCISTQAIIEHFEKTDSKNKVIFLDCCYAGKFNINNSTYINVEDLASDFIGKGYAVLASSNATEVSYCNPNKPISLFTSFLCETLTDKYIIKRGKKSLNDIQKLLFFYLYNWNKKNPDRQQHPIYRASLTGTIVFDVDDYKPFHVPKIYFETEKYIICDVSPIHTASTKRYAVKILLKNPYCIEEIAEINKEITKYVKPLDIYKGESLQQRFAHRDANIIFCYYGRKDTDILNGTYFCKTTWVDEEQDKTNWYKLNKDDELINDIHFQFFSYYNFITSFIEQTTGNKEEVIEATLEIITAMIQLAEQVIILYNEFLNGCKTEDQLVIEFEPLITNINVYFFKESNLPNPPNEIHIWSQKCSLLTGTIYDFTLFYNKRFLNSRTPENRKSCMDIAINRYYEDLQTFKDTPVIDDSSTTI